MSNGHYRMDMPANEPAFRYLPGSEERENIQRELERQMGEVVKIPLIIGGREIWTEKTGVCTVPHLHSHVLAEYSVAGEKELRAAIDAAMEAKAAWESMPFEHRASIFLKAAALLTGPYRAVVNAATMLCQSKTVHQAEIDSACELADFFRFNAYYAQQIYEEQPNHAPGEWNRLEYRPLEGFVAAVTPFNFTSIGGNLPSAPALMGNEVLWKPASSVVLSNYYVMKVLLEAGLPAGAIQFVPCSGADMSRFVLRDPRLAGFHFTGSTGVFESVWSMVGQNIRNYRSYPRLVGETGGKDFIFAHKSASVKALVSALARGAFEYQGQKCSAASRAYIPASLWPEVKEGVLKAASQIRTGDVSDFSHEMGAVIDKNAFESITAYIDEARQSADAEVLCGGYDGSTGYFIYPTVIEAKRPDYKTMTEEIFGPVLTVYAYPDEAFEEMLKLCDSSTPYALSGAIFARDRGTIVHMEEALRNSAGNFYINDKPTGAVVGQQPFGGARASGTNDKAGSRLNLYRWVSPRTIKELFAADEEGGIL